MVEEVKEVEAFQKLLTYKIVVGRGDGRPKAFDTTERAADHLSVSVDLKVEVYEGCMPREHHTSWRTLTNAARLKQLSR